MASGKNSQVGQAVEEFRQALLNGEARHDGSPSLTRHVPERSSAVHAHRIPVAWAFPDRDKIDATYAAVMAWKARDRCCRGGFGR